MLFLMTLFLSCWLLPPTASILPSPSAQKPWLITLIAWIVGDDAPAGHFVRSSTLSRDNGTGLMYVYVVAVLGMNR